MFKNIKELVDAEENGATIYTTFRKLPGASATITVWQDLAMSPGYPSPIYYASNPMEAVTLNYNTHGGIYHGGNVYPKQKILRKSLIMASTTGWNGTPFILCDYLMYYPFIDESDNTEQFTIASATLPRYTNGLGVMMMAVSVGARIGGQSYVVKYTNSDGVSGRTTPIIFQNSSTVNGSIVVNNNTSVNTTSMPFLPLQAGDKGVRSIESVKMISGTDSGLFTLVLVKPIYSTTLIEQTAAVEVDSVLNRGLTFPEIKDNACLNIICGSNAAFASVGLYGEFKFVFN